LNLKPWFNADATKQSVASRDIYGKVTWSAQVPLKVRVQPSRKIIRGVSGQEVATTAVLYTATACGPTDRFWFDGANVADVNAARIPLGVDTAKDKAGNAVFFKVWF
jgi:hypothetical protein